MRMNPADRAVAPAAAGHSWAVAIFAARESAANLEDAIEAIARAATGKACRIDVLVNGNPALADELARRLLKGSGASRAGLCIDVWFLEVGDKAQTWNAYVHRLDQGSELTFFVDGYVRVAQNALAELCSGLKEAPGALAATGVPSCGASAARQAASMLRSGGIHGNLFVLPRFTMDEIRRRGIKLPMGLYRTDSLIGAILNFAFEPAAKSWDPARIKVQASATWQITPLRWWHPGDIRTHLKRLGRQSQGVLENLAVSDHLGRRRQAPESLPATARELVLQWWHGGKGPKWHQFLRHPSWLMALRRFRAIRDWSKADLAPRLVCRCPQRIVAAPSDTSHPAF